MQERGAAVRHALGDLSHPARCRTSARPQSRPRLRGAFCAAVALLLSVLGVFAFGLRATPAAAADEPTALVKITLTGFSPSVVEPGDTVRISGRVTNISGKPLHRLSAYFWRSTFPLTSSEQLDAALKSDSNDPLGSRRAGFEQYDTLFTADKPNLAPKASVDFSLHATTTELLGANPTNGVYLMGVHVLSEGGGTAIGRSRIFVPVTNPALSSDSSNLVQMSSLVMLTSSPSQLRPGVLADDHLAGEVAPGGRLDQLLRAADQPGTSYAIDPNLIAELRTMSAGYQVAGADGELAAGTGRGAATAWLRRFTALQATHNGFRLPYASYDLPALAHQHRLDVAEAGEAAAKKVNGVGSLPLLVAPAGGTAGQSTVDAAEKLGARAVLLNNHTVGGLGPVLQQSGGMTILGYDTDTSSGGPGPAPDDTPVHLRQSALASTYIEALTSSAGSTVGQLRVVTSPDQSGGDIDAGAAPWLELSDVGQLLQGDPIAWKGKPSYSSAAKKKELGSGAVAETDLLTRDFGTYRHLLANPDDLSGQLEQTLPRVASSSWRGQEEAQAQFVHEQTAAFDQVLHGTAIHLVAKDLVLTGAAGNVPITVVNDYNHAVKVQIRFTSPNEQRLSVQTVTANEIGVVDAGGRVTVSALVRARANGRLPVTCWLTTTTGARIGRPLTIQVDPTQAGRIGWLISLGAGIVLVGATAFRIRQVRRERARSEASGG